MKSLRFKMLSIVMLSGILLGQLVGNWQYEGLVYLGILTGISGCIACIGFAYDLVEEKKVSVITSTVLGFFALALFTAMLNQQVLHQFRTF